jgi:uncharacterized damage-inducible protein DinB
LKPSAVDAVSKLVAYDRRAFESFERGIKRLGWAEAVKEREMGHHSFKNTLVHILNVHEVWFVAAPRKNWDIFKDPTRRPDNAKSWGDLRRYRERVWSGIDDLMSGLTEEKLGRRVTVPWFKGRYTLEDGIFQSSFEQAHHLGEIIGAYWQMDRAPPQMMWVPLMSGIRASVR